MFFVFSHARNPFSPSLIPLDTPETAGIDFVFSLSVKYVFSIGANF